MKNKFLAFFVLAILILPACDFWSTKSDSSVKAIIIDTLDRDSYNEIHIKGAVHIPLITPDGELHAAYSSKQAFEKEIKRLTKSSKIDPQVVIFAYCSNDVCTSSHVVAEKLQEFGYNANPYVNGLDGWLTLQLWSGKKDLYPIEPALKQGMKFKAAPYLQYLLENEPSHDRLVELERNAAPVLAALQKMAA